MSEARDLNDLSAFLVAGDAGDVIFRKGDAGSELFVVRHGRIELMDDVGDSGRRLVVLEAGDVFGEAQVFGGGSRPVAARAVTEYQLLRIDRAALEQITAEDPSVALGMIERMARRAWPPAADRPAPAPRAGAAAAARPTDEPAAGAPWLTLVSGDAAFDLSARAELVVGRVDRATGYVPDVDLTAFDDARSLSRRHARLANREGRVFVREEKATRNGTFVGGVRLQTGTEVELTPGVTVRFGLVEAVFERR